MKLSEVAKAVGGSVVGDPDAEVDRPVDPRFAQGPEDLAVAIDGESFKALAETKARYAVVAEGRDVPDDLLAGYVTAKRPRLALAEITILFEDPVPRSNGVHPQAAVDPLAEIGANVSVGPFAVIGANAAVGEGSVVAEQASIGPGARVGAGCRIEAGARIAHGVVLGDRVIVHQNAVVGSDGFSFTTPNPGSIEAHKRHGQIVHTNEELVRVHSVGTVIVGDEVEIGAGTTIDRGTLKDTIIKTGAKIDNLVQIGHNVEIGENAMICGQVGIAGSATLGDRVVLAGQAGVADHTTVGDDTIVVAGSGVHGDVPEKEVMYGMPALRYPDAAKLFLNQRRLGRLYENVEELRSAVKELKKGAGGD